MTFALLTDFGLHDTYVGIIKSVIIKLNPNAAIIDLCHSVHPFSITDAAFSMLTCLPYLPDTCIILAVVDPGVGTARKPLAIQKHNQYFVGPNNGIFSYILDSWVNDHDTPTQHNSTKRTTDITANRMAIKDIAIHEITNPDILYIRDSETFHGRDIFAPAAAHLSLGCPIEHLGKKLAYQEIVHLPSIQYTEDHHYLYCNLLYIDHFGNMISNIPNSVIHSYYEFGDTILMYIQGKTYKIPFKQSFGYVNPGEYVCYKGSAGFLEVGIYQENLAHKMGIITSHQVSKTKLAWKISKP